MKTRTIWAMYPAWAYEREMADNDALSRQGWQLTHMGLFHSKYVYDEGAVYRYALDFDQDIADPARYRETFAEQGWELVNSTFNGWHMFRKRYDPDLPEEAYRIYTDEQSIRQMQGRWKRLLSFLGWIELATGLLQLAMQMRSPQASGLLIGLGAVSLGLILLLGVKRVKAEDRFLASGWVLAPTAVCLLAGLALMFMGK